jgi:hypothetical protein
MEEIWDSCRRIPMGRDILSCEWTVRGTPILWIPSQVVDSTNVFKRQVFIYFLSYLMRYMALHFIMCMRLVFMCCCR